MTTSSVSKRRRPDVGEIAPSAPGRANRRATDAPAPIVPTTSSEWRSLGFMRCRWAAGGWLHPAGDHVGDAILSGEIPRHEAERIAAAAVGQQQQIRDARAVRRYEGSFTPGGH